MSGEIKIQEQQLSSVKFQWTLKDLSNSLKSNGEIISPVFQLFGMPFVLTLGIKGSNLFQLAIAEIPDTMKRPSAVVRYEICQNLAVSGRFSSTEQKGDPENWSDLRSLTGTFFSGKYKWSQFFTGGLNALLTVEFIAERPGGKFSSNATSKCSVGDEVTAAEKNCECKNRRIISQSTQTDFNQGAISFTSIEEAIKALECQVCHSVMEPPIHLCATGHSICDKCKPEVAQCPSCQNQFLGGVRNFTLESLTDYTIHPCSANGCSSTYTRQNRDAHRREACLYRDLGCSACDWKWQLNSFKDHVERRHPTLMKRIVYDKFTPHLTPLAAVLEGDVCEFLLGDDDALFQLHMKTSDGYIFLCILHFGTSTSAKKYRFTIELESIDKEIEFYTRSMAKVHCDLDCVDRECVLLGTEKQLRKQGLVTANGEIKLQYCIMQRA